MGFKFGSRNEEYKRNIGEVPVCCNGKVLLDKLDEVLLAIILRMLNVQDTEFPGVVAKPICEFGASDFTYQVGKVIIVFRVVVIVSNNNVHVLQTLRCNCDMLKLIQLGLSFTDEKGNFADDCVCWQFNFKFSLV